VKVDRRKEVVANEMALIKEAYRNTRRSPADILTLAEFDAQKAKVLGS
jgi:hypothetical protein